MGNIGTDKGAWIVELIDSFCDTSENTLQNQGNDKAFADPLVGFANGADGIWEDYKEHVGPFHWTPSEVFGANFPEIGVKAEDLTIISWILPQTPQTKSDNRKEDFYPAERWARARIFGEAFNVKLREHVVAELTKAGYSAVAPMLAEGWSVKESDKYVFASTWSERHAAYAAGLGTFGLCDGLITPKGKAMRTGSVVAAIPVEATPRPYTYHREYCLYFTKGICKKCIPRCPVGALSEDGHDKKTCLAHLHPVTEDYVTNNYGFAGYGCGLCQVGVPCESKIPLEKDVD